MKCPYCGNEDTKVIDSRPFSDGNSIKRRRKCDNCNNRFNTTEKIFIYIIKLKSDDIVPLELDLDETENLYTRWIDIRDAGKLTLDMKTIFSLHIYANMIR